MVTRIRFGTRMRVHVMLECILAGQALSTQRTRMRSYSRVHLHVSGQHVAQGKRAHTAVALERLLVCVHDLDVPGQLPALLERLCTVLALELPHHPMSLHVHRVLRPEHELFSTLPTREPLLRVRVHVSPQHVPVVEHLPAHVAAEVASVQLAVVRSPCLCRGEGLAAELTWVRVVRMVGLVVGHQRRAEAEFEATELTRVRYYW